MWRQFYNMARAGTQSIYISMFDEFGEVPCDPPGTSRVFMTKELG